MVSLMEIDFRQKRPSKNRESVSKGMLPPFPADINKGIVGLQEAFKSRATRVPD
jgi:hypothetical protein